MENRRPSVFRPKQEHQFTESSVITRILKASLVMKYQEDLEPGENNESKLQHYDKLG